MASSHVERFRRRVYPKTREFSIPKKTCDALGIWSEDSVHLVVRDQDGKELFQGRKTLKSGSEIYGKDIAPVLVPGSIILVEAAEPRLSKARREQEILAEDHALASQERLAGYQPDIEVRNAVEQHAMRLAKQELARRGFASINDRSSSMPYDFECEREGLGYYVEVKGTQGKGEAVIVTKNEVKHRNSHPSRSIAIIVHSIKVDAAKKPPVASGGAILIFEPWEINPASLEPTQYLWTVPKPPKQGTH